MIKRTAQKVFLLLLISVSAYTLQAQMEDKIPNRPNPPRLVNDFANVLSSGDLNALEIKLTNYNDSTSTQIAVVTIKTIEGYEISDYAYSLGRKWGVGQKDLNNGIVLLIAVDDRKMFIATGYGTEAYITDARASQIYRDILTPAFQQQKYYDGIDEATTEMINYLSGQIDGDPMGSSSDKPSVWSVIFIILLILFLLSRFKGGNGGTTYSRRGPVYWGGGGFGGFGGGGGGGGGFGGFGGGGFGGGGAGGRW